jgi:DNA (cytosine-5)-methyltransferase 1
VGGFPCQDYSVAKPLSQAEGIRGKKGVLWWEIHRLLEIKKPKYVLLENVDRLLKSPVKQRGRDFAVILACFARLGYGVEWRVVNAADYGFPQRRRRVFIYAEKVRRGIDWDPAERLVETGVLARALPVVEREAFESDQATVVVDYVELPHDVYEVSSPLGMECRTSPFREAGVMLHGHVWTKRLTPDYRGKKQTLGDIVRKTKKVEASFLVDGTETLEKWAYLKGAKREPRVDKQTGFEYFYSEGAMVFPDALDRPSRTILTGEGGTSPSRFKHVVQPRENGPLRRLVPEELEELNGFPRGWTNTGMSDMKRAFCMGNALVVGIVERIGEEIAVETGTS